jgi:hypothetical protein
MDVAQIGAVIELSSLDGSNGFKLSGGAGDASGYSVASAGDVNGDGFADVIVGAPRADANGSNSGASYVVFGNASGFAADFNLSSLDGSNGFRLSGVSAGDDSGFSVASAGDVNGDGFADVIVGAYGAVPKDASYVVFGKASGFAANLNLSSLDGSNGFKLSDQGAYSYGGHTVASAGDVNGDGFADLIIGSFGASPNGGYYGDPYSYGMMAGASYVVFGQASGFAANFNLSNVDGSNGFKLSGAERYDLVGRSVASAGDINGDGFDDLIVGAGGADGCVVFGQASGFAANIQVSSLNGSDGFKLGGAGWSVASAGDVNGDGFADLIVGNGSFSGGASYVVFGRASSFAATFSLSSLDGGNGFKLSGAGYSVASAGDVNGDGFADLIVGDHLADVNGSNSGSSYVVFGKASGFAANLNLTSLDGGNGFKLNGGAAVDISGFSVASAGDINGDGFADLIVGAPNAGASYVVFGGVPEAIDYTGTEADDTMAGGAFGDSLSGLGGDDSLSGYGAADILNGGAGDDHIDGGAGVDTATYSDAAGVVTVRLLLTNAQDTGGAGIDTLVRIENLTGSAFADTLIGDGGTNVLTGLDGADLLNGGGGADRMSGGLGNDTYVVNKAGDQVTEGNNPGDVDTVKVSIDYTLGANVENLILIGAGAIDGTGNELANKLTGNAEANVLSGLAGADRLSGGGSSDTLIGGAGRDILTGGADADTFRYLSASETGATGATRDTIADFVAGTDKIDLAAIDAVDDGADDAFSFIGAAAFSGTAGELRAKVAGANTLVSGDLDGDAVADFQILLAGTHTLSAGDFLL